MVLLNKLPTDVAEEMKWMAWNASWHTANTRKGYTADAVADKIGFEDHATNMHKLAEGLGVAGSTLDHIKWGAWNAAWYTANTRAGYTGDANSDLASYEEHFAAVKRAAEFTAEISDNIKWMCWNAAWHCANTRVGYDEDSKADLSRFEFRRPCHYMHKLAEGLGVAGSTLDHIKWGAWNAAWYTANTRAGYTGDANSDLASYEEHFAAVKRAAEFTAELSDNIKWMCWNAAWHCANTRVGYDEDSKADLSRFEHHAAQISGEVNLIDIQFNVEKAQVLSLKPKRIAEQELINKTNIQQSQAFKVTYSKGRTNSWNNKVGFKVGTKTTIKAGFALLAEAKVEVSFEATYEHSWSTSDTQTETVTYEFPVTVGPHTIVLASAMIQEAQMSVPYELTLDIGGSQRKISGTWEGVSYSRVTSKFDEKPLGILGK